MNEFLSFFSSAAVVAVLVAALVNLGCLIVALRPKVAVSEKIRKRLFVVGLFNTCLLTVTLVWVIATDDVGVGEEESYLDSPAHRSIMEKLQEREK